MWRVDPAMALVVGVGLGRVLCGKAGLDLGPDRGLERGRIDLDRQEPVCPCAAMARAMSAFVAMASMETKRLDLAHPGVRADAGLVDDEAGLPLATPACP